MIPLTKIGKHLLWQLLEGLLNIYLLFYGKHMSLMEVQDLPNIIFINQMYLAQDLY